MLFSPPLQNIGLSISDQSWNYRLSCVCACLGGAGPRHHELLWHNLKKNKPLACLECGQIFRLVDHMEWLEWAATEWDVNKQDTIQFFLPESE